MKVVDDLSKEIVLLYALGNVYDDIRELNPRSISNCSFTFVPKKGKVAAYTLV